MVLSDKKSYSFTYQPIIYLYFFKRPFDKKKFSNVLFMLYNTYLCKNIIATLLLGKYLSLSNNVLQQQQLDVLLGKLL